MDLAIRSISGLWSTITQSATRFQRGQEVANKTRNLYLAIIISNYFAFCFGISVGWVNPAQRLILNGNSYGFSMSSHQWELISSLLPIGIAIGCLPMGALMKSFGCKCLLCVQVVPYIGAWFLFIYADSIYMIYAARFLQGMCGAAVCQAVPVYLNEISQSKYRGAVGTTYYGALLYGIIYSHLMMENIRLQTVYIVNLVMSSPFIFVLIIPDSPFYYASVRKLEKARSALIWLRGAKYNVEDELRLMVLLANNNIDAANDWWKSFKYSTHFRMVIRSIGLMIFHHLIGGVAIMFMDDMLHIATGERYMDFLWWLCVFMAIGHLISFILVDRVGRRPLLVISTVIVLFCSFYLCCWFRVSLGASSNFFTKLVMYIFVLGYTLGLGAVCCLLNVELILHSCRPFGCAITNLFSWLTICLVQVWLYFPKYECVIFDGLIVIVLLSLLFIFLFVPETNGLSPTEIQKLLDVTLDASSSDES